MFPINIVEPEICHFDGAQTVSREQHQDGAVTHICGTSYIQIGKKPLHIRPQGPRRQFFLRIDSRPLNDFCQMRWPPSCLSAVAEKCPESSHNVANSDTSPSLTTPESKVGVNILNMGPGEGPPQRTVPPKELSNRAAELMNTIVGEATLSFGPVAISIQ